MVRIASGRGEMDSITGRLWRFRHAALGVAVLIGGAGAVVWFLRATVGALSQLNPNFASAIVAALAGVVVVVLGQVFNRSRQVSEAHRDRKVQVYSTFVQLIIDLQQATIRMTADELLKSEQTYRIFVKFNRDVLLWGSPNVIRAFLDYRGEDGTATPLALVKMDKLLGAIRKDLGLSNWRLQKGDLVKILVRDPSELDKMLRQ
jgi:hypothetical protein